MRTADSILRAEYGRARRSSMLAEGATIGANWRPQPGQDAAPPAESPHMMNSFEHGREGDNAEHQAPVLLMPPPRRKRKGWQLWRNRLFLVEFVLVCLLIGIILIAAPWTSLWTSNSLLAGFPQVRQFLMNDFVRGGISGLGLVDVWLGFWEAIQYREGAD